jgi:hypothetical protein
MEKVQKYNNFSLGFFYDALSNMNGGIIYELERILKENSHSPIEVLSWYLPAEATKTT